MKYAEVAKKLADDIFECGDDPDSPCIRIQFMGGSLVNGTEVGQGGFVKTSFEDFLRSRLLEYLND